MAIGRGERCGGQQEGAKNVPRLQDQIAKEGHHEVICSVSMLHPLPVC
jgi:hypothetical protein